MSKEYFCKDCIHNNNGWCKEKKFNGLKKIIECELRKIEGYLSEEGQIQYNETIDSLYKDIDYTPYKNFGKREMFYHIQRQLEVMDNDLTVKDVKQIMVNLEKVLQIEEQIQGIAYEYEIDEDIAKSSKFISNKWFKEVGEYKGDEK